MIITTTCPNLACAHSVDVEFTPGSPAQTYGPPEQCDPGSDDEFAPDTCPECGAALDTDTIIETANNRVSGDKEARSEAHDRTRAEWRSEMRNVKTEFGGREY